MIGELSITAADIIRKQRELFQTGKTKDVAFRIAQLKILKQAILDNESAIVQALKADLHKPEFETYATEIFVLKEIDYAIKNLKNWVKPQKAAVPIEFLQYSAKIYPEPLGVVLIIGPWNYPFNLITSPLVGAIASGNCTILKPSELAPHTSSLLAEIIAKYFEPAYIALVEGGVETSQNLLAEKFDHIFFTGGTSVGKIVMEAAAKHLTPVTLELGGKSPCIVDNEINLEQTARRITWGKFINAGQTCIAPDYILVDKKIKNNLIDAIKKCIKEFYGDNPAKSPDFARIISQKHFDRLANLLKNGEVIIGGEINSEELYIAPTLLDNVSLEDAVMQEEIFGPILPIIEYGDIKDAIALINSRPKPLALYLFTQNKSLQKRILQETSSGGVCLNDTVLQFGVPSLPFGGVSDSGIGSYHGKASFDTFSHRKSVLQNSFLLDINWRYAPYQGKLAFLKRILGY
ncbi:MULTISPECIES: aldehyde dehydrogenase [unclassified Tolypothrix]|uniref:aldehyde dehydrogenase n=1 Tax=unclassified Tolypothrix TaxID=2649714 RepID=UPI0005EAAD69|nr:MULTISPECIES: aldehyde dehydrogenase [unclassified Tolypothrix]BAY90937.1 aldehyde dehydrogenase [Microchaete diplosiphon NIES-3275]EKE99817.1 aldehyde dehydrogenase family protein [Tolypothrix sp. PCC 7601]MBE9082754.1 aldehyde dehydrogenase [Tolypothrix sp. LEGE 11397]UYD25051.1 aldehyde dehydrogenase [Tolypothrix sp. PCC 7712]UYD32711.1 aldehyde dehydrogenase [Tolypothrix sp. PCC 7601]